MNVRLSPEIERRLAEFAAQRNLPPEQIVEDALLAHLDELTQVRETLDRRYEDLASGRVKPIDGDDAIARFRAKRARRRAGLL